MLPKKYGRIPSSWLATAKLHEESLTSFASQLLTIMPIVLAFFVDCVAPHGFMAEHIECLSLLVSILGLLSAGLEMTDARCDLLRDLVQRHHEVWLRIYGTRGIKPKWHHMLHLPALYRRLRKAISCFAWERKHRSAKRVAIFVFRHSEHTTLTGMLHEQCEQIRDGHTLFQRSFLVRPMDVQINDSKLVRSTEAVLFCGHLHADDILYTLDGAFARVVYFWQSAASLDGGELPIIAQCTLCEKINETVYRDSRVVSCIDEDSIVDAVVYKPMSETAHCFRVIKPYIAPC